ncbi:MULTISPECIES: phospholipase [Oleiagrimonas]|uniref:Phospholipase n=1 Tax=Oleiagrimonas citrea TaxID=1665687 RepID=A0A846ZLP6_9GAMM|nr:MULTISPECIES: phospholipase [Oleiagrimonas]NKZ38896.1 phospholipase [Oleiagrimonas citrea]RAP59128.1 hypothetical protein BTJ49_00055 [Oleiagrimonas sp. MCCC 1A03011]
MAKQLVVFVHGWSVTSTSTYGELPARLKAEASRRGGPDLDVRQIHLGEYVSFRDEVRVHDIARAFDAALGKVLADAGGKQRCVCITHSTGGPVVREWLDRFVVQADRLSSCPISHLIMLAPANFGSALARLGKSRIGGIKAWFNGVEPGQGVLDWLELGSPESCALNLRWIHDYPALKLTRGRHPLYPFVLSGDAIDRKLYDHINPYTGENGSDGVVRLAGANLNAAHVVLRQPAPEPDEPLPTAKKRLRALELESAARSEPCAFRIIPHASHSGTDMGIMGAVRNDQQPNATVEQILRCLGVRSAREYDALREAFDRENAAHQQPAQRLETEHVPVLPDREYIHDPCCMALVRLFDSTGLRVSSVDMLLTAGPQNDPNQLPSGFLVDRQANARQPGNLCFYLNHAVLEGCPPIPRADGSIARPELKPRPPYGLHVRPRGGERFVEYWDATLDVSVQSLLPLLRPNETTLVDIHLSRIVREGVFGFTRQLAPPHDFRDVPPGGAV